MRRIEVKCGELILKLGSRTYIMGILNLTPDSFSDGGKFSYIEDAIRRAKEMVEDGADIIDLGGESTRPGYIGVPAEEEIERILPVLNRLVSEIHVPISIDTSKAYVADCMLKAGASMINDVGGLQRDPEMSSICSRHQVPVVVMHNQHGTDYKGDIMAEIADFLRKSVEIALKAGISGYNIILDPGIGFGKTLEQNIEVLSRLEELTSLGYPILLGTSRKGMFGRILSLPPSERVEATISTSVIGVTKGVDIIRVHDVKENFRAVKVADAILRRTV